MEYTEQTLGKRIMAHRKRLGLTQDQLAEKLGVTAQAVSKWENDQSCPDIATLPRLADIFGTTVDTLLGREEPVHQGQIVEDEDDSQEPEGIHIQNGDKSSHWDFQWDSFDTDRKNTIVFALAVLIVGCLTLASVLLDWDVSFWSILWPCAIVYIGIMGLWPKFSFFCLACALLGGYFLLYNLKVIHLNLGWELALPVLLVVLGISLLVDALRKKRKPKSRKTHLRSDGTERQSANQFEIDGTEFTCSGSFCDVGSQLICMPLLTRGQISLSFGELTVDLTGVEELSEDCSLRADCSFGELVLQVPRRFAVDVARSTAFASLNFQGQPNPTPDGILHLSANVSFGEIRVEYV